MTCSSSIVDKQGQGSPPPSCSDYELQTFFYHTTNHSLIIPPYQPKTHPTWPFILYSKSWAPTSSLWPFGPAFCPWGLLHFNPWALRPCDPRNNASDPKITQKPKKITKWSKDFHQESQKIVKKPKKELLTNPKKICNEYNLFCQKIQQLLSRYP